MGAQSRKSKTMKSSHALSVLVAASIGSAMAQSSADLWDVSQGTLVTASSPILSSYSAGAMFGENGQNNGNGSTWTYFADGQPAGFTHFVEWQTPANVNVARVQVYAFGDSFFGIPNNEREFSHFTLRAKSPGSLVYDLTVIEYDATHPYSFVGPNFLLIDQAVPTVTAQQFRAEFTQFDAGAGFDGPRIVELDAFSPPPPTLTAQPESVVLNLGMPAKFTVQATGTGALSYQWYKDGTPIAGQTGTSFRIAAAGNSDIGAYTVSVTDANGTTMSAPATLTIDYLNAQQSNADLFDVNSGIVVTAHTPLQDVPPIERNIYGMFGGFTQFPESDWTYFADNQATGTVHSVEWTTANPVTVRSLRLFAHGDSFLNNGREFDKLTLKAKSPGSPTFNVVVATFTPGHPYTFLDNELILDTEVTPVTAGAFRAEFLQYTAGFGFDGPRIVELDAFDGRPLLRPTVVVGPDSRTVPKNTQITWKVVARGGSLSYQWKFMGQNIAGATTDTLQLKKAKATDQGYYTVVVSNAAGSVESAQALLLVTPN
jgi:hypothetical protein